VGHYFLNKFLHKRKKQNIGGKNKIIVDNVQIITKLEKEIAEFKL